MKTYFITLLLALAGVFLINFQVDVSGLRTYPATYALATAQSETQLLVRHESFDQRAWTKARLIERQICPDVLILGSSTLGGINSAHFAGKKVLNAWMTGPSMQDFEATTAQLEQRHCVPPLVLFGIDPWFFDPTDINLRWLSAAQDYIDFYRRHGSARELISARWEVLVGMIEPLQDQLSYQATKETLKSVLKTHKFFNAQDPPRLFNGDLAEFCVDKTIPYYIRYSDGHWDRCAALERPLSEVIEIGQSYVANGNGLAQWKKLDQLRISRLDKLLQIWSARGSHVILIAPPHNPYAYRSLMDLASTRQRLRELDLAVDNLATRYHASFVNLRDPARLGCRADEFRDAYHLYPSCVDKLIRQLQKST